MATISPNVGGLLSLIPNVVGGVISKFSHNKYANLLEKSTLDMPSQYDDARGIYQKLAATGLPGVDQAKLDLMGNVPSTLKAYQSVSDNPASILGALSDSQTGVNRGLTDLSIRDAVAKLGNMQNLGEYMKQEGAVSGEYDRYNNQLKLSAGAERMAGTAELLKGITGGVAGGISAYANLDMAKSFADMNKSVVPIETPASSAPAYTAPNMAGAPVNPSKDTPEQLLAWLKSMGLSGASGSGQSQPLMNLILNGMGTSMFSPVAK